MSDREVGPMIWPGRTDHARARSSALRSFTRPARSSGCVLRGKPQIRTGHPKGPCADRRSGAPRRGGGPFHRQEWPRCSISLRRPASTHRALSLIGTGKEQRIAQPATSSSSAASRWGRARNGRRGDHHCRIRFRRAQRRRDRRSGARCAAARLFVRPLQDQAQGRRRPAEQSRGRVSPAPIRGGAEKAWARAARYCRRRRAGARPYQ